ncbi:MAG: Gldg family protein [Betaproteobacteria bacterium]|nr:Gldg family protein [Betaproteobacteria bacterium]
MKNYESVLYSAAGCVALAVLLVAFNFLASTVAVRADLTDGRLYTLSDGTRKILGKLDAPVKLRLYISKGESAMPVQLRSFAQRVEDVVREFKSVAGANLVIEKYNPKPDSDEEDAAQLDGIEPQQLGTGEAFYLGLSVSQLDRKQAIPAVSPQRERLLEYDLIRAIARVATPDKPVLGLMSAVPVLGERFNPMTRQGSEPWVLANELKRDFNVKTVNMSAETIDPGIKVLLLIHPRDISDKTEYALDQFVLRGGKLIAFVDPFMFFDQQPNPMMPMQQQQGTSSSLPTLFKAWGIEMDPGKVIADVVFASGGGQRYTPTVLSLNRTALNREDVTTSQIESLLYAFGGAFVVKPPEGLKVTELIKSSATSMMVDNVVASVSGDAATKGFVPSGKSLPLALRLTGKFKTAFPSGLKPDEPAKPAAKDAKPEAKTAAPQLKESGTENSVILVADADMLADGAAVDVQTVFGQRVVVPSNGNLNLAQNMVEQLFAGDDLIGLRSRATGFRPLTVIREMEARAQQQYFGKIQSLEKELQQSSEKIQSLQKGRADAKSAQILSPQQQAELEAFRKRVIETRHDLKELRKNLRQDAESLQFWTKVVNIAVMPLLVAFLGLGFAMLRRKRAAAI